MLSRRAVLLDAYHAQQALGSGYATNLALEAAHLFPRDANEVTPTRLGNAIRAFETYAWRQYSLDSQTLWEPLWSVISQALRDEHDHARAGVDFCVSAIATLVLFATTALGMAIASAAASGQVKVGLLVAAVAAPILGTIGFYEIALSGCVTWGITVKGMVDVGRVPLAAALGLRFPDTLAEEREMWRLVSRFARESRPDADWTGADGFDLWRMSGPPPRRRR